MTRTFLLCIILATCITLAGKAMAQGKVVIKVFDEIAQAFGFKGLSSMWTEHDRVWPVDDTTFIIPAGNFTGTRISVNFNHKSWVPRGSAPVTVRFTVHGVGEELRKLIRVQMKADKGRRKDRDRGSDWLHDGIEFYLKYGTSGDRAYYFAERGQVKGEHLPGGAYFKLVRID